jgi:hypothetical protein
MATDAKGVAGMMAAIMPGIRIVSAPWWALNPRLSVFSRQQ